MPIDLSPPSRPFGLASTLVLALGTFAVGTDAFVVAAFLPAMAQGLAVTPAAAGQSVTAFALAYALLAPVIATATASLPRRALMIGALVSLGMANLGSAVAPTLGVLIATRIAAAAAAAAYTPNAGAVAAALVRPDLRARALAVVIGGLTIATALGVPLGRVASAALSWRAALGLVGAISFAAALGVLAIMPRVPGNPRVPLGERLALLRRPGVMAVLPLTVLGMAACYMPYAFTVQVLQAVAVPDGAVTAMLFCYDRPAQRRPSGGGGLGGRYGPGGGPGCPADRPEYAAQPPGQHQARPGVGAAPSPRRR
ncbi:MAG TPA: MFS transporter [Roseomonas sp.]|nr:MFS transporter [Roseomonas sp.]